MGNYPYSSASIIISDNNNKYKLLLKIKCRD